MPAVVWVAVGLLAAGAIFMAGGGLLVVGAIRGRRAGRARTL
jgi:septum formation inhibitor MinC